MSKSSGKVGGSPPDAPDRAGPELSRRAFMKSVGLTAGAAVVPVNLRDTPAAVDSSAPSALGPGKTQVDLRINGETKTLNIEPRMTLADALRDELDLTGTKVVCGRGACGGCTVHIDGESIKSCMLLAVDARGAEILTIEGLAAADGTLDPVQQAFIDQDAQQCGYCTPGMVMRARAFLNENPSPTLDEAKAGMAGNICRCGTYTHVLQAVMQAAEKEA